MKICKCCLVEKNYNEFNKLRKSKDGLKPICRECQKSERLMYKDTLAENKKIYYEKNKDILLEKSRNKYQENPEKFIQKAHDYYHSNKELVSERAKKYRGENKEIIKQRKKDYETRKKIERLAVIEEYKNSLITVEYPPDYKICSKCHSLKHETEYNFMKNKNSRADLRKGICRTCSTAASKEYRTNNSEVLRAKERKKYHANPEKVREKKRKLRQSEKYKTNRKLPENRIVSNMSQYIRYTLNEVGLKKDGKATMKYVGCIREFYRNHVESQFMDGMTWNNYGKKLDEWSVDHYIPREAFNLINQEEQDVCFHWTNCSPMWHTENEIKQDIMPDGKKARDTKNEYSLIEKKRLILSNLLSRNLPYVTKELLLKETIYSDIIHEFFP